eukprot:3230380-Rhodomonas_salina.3
MQVWVSESALQERVSLSRKFRGGPGALSLRSQVKHTQPRSSRTLYHDCGCLGLMSPSGLTRSDVQS